MPVPPLVPECTLDEVAGEPAGYDARPGNVFSGVGVDAVVLDDYSKDSASPCCDPSTNPDALAELRNVSKCAATCDMLEQCGGFTVNTNVGACYIYQVRGGGGRGCLAPPTCCSLALLPSSPTGHFHTTPLPQATRTPLHPFRAAIASWRMGPMVGPWIRTARRTRNA